MIKQTIIRLSDVYKYGWNYYNAIADLAIDAQRTHAGSMTALTNNSGGTAASSIPSLVIPSKSNTGGAFATKASFDTQVAACADALNVIGTYLQAARTYYGLSAGTIPAPNTAGTIAAISGTTTTDAGTGGTAVDATTGLDRMTKLKNNLATVAKMANEFLGMTGAPTFTDGSGGTSTYEGITSAPTLVAAAATGSAVTVSGTVYSINKADADTFFTAIKNDVATLATKINAVAGVAPTSRRCVFVP